jgi:predicted type IV restriction endonuclease
MDFIDKIKQHASVVESLKNRCQTEESTKHSLVLPVLNLLGYDVFNPLEIVPEYIADLGIKKGGKSRLCDFRF